MLDVECTAEPFMRIRASGLLGADDYRQFEEDFANELRRATQPVGLLLDMRGFRGWTPRGFLRDLQWDLRNRNTFSKIAVIGDARWHKWISVAGALLFNGQLSYFSAKQANLAQQWLSDSRPRRSPDA